MNENKFDPKVMTTYHNIVKSDTVNDILSDSSRIRDMLECFDRLHIKIGRIVFNPVQYSGSNYLVGLLAAVNGPLVAIGENPVIGYDLDYKNADPTEIYINIMVDIEGDINMAKTIYDTIFDKFYDEMIKIESENSDSVFNRVIITKGKLNGNNTEVLSREYHKLLKVIEQVNENANASDSI